MSEPHPLRRRQLELIALCTDPDRQTAKLAIFFGALMPEPTIAKLADYRHAVTMQDPDRARQIIAELLQQDQEART